VFLDWARQEAAAVSPSGHRPPVPAADDQPADKPARFEPEAPAFLAGRPRPTSSDDADLQPTRRTPEPVGDLWGYKGDVKRPAADAAGSSGFGAAVSGAGDSAAIVSAGGIGAVGAASSSAQGASRGGSAVTPPSTPMARPAGGHPAWERPPKMENFPRLHSRGERSSNSPLLLAMVGVAILVVFLFAWPFLSGSGNKTPVATHTPSATATVVTSPTPTTAPTATPLPSGGFVYTVQSNDTLFAIEQKFGVSQEAILAINPQITDPAVIHAGDQIKIPPTGTGASASASSSAS